MPETLSVAFTEVREYLGIANGLPDGNSTRFATTTNSRKYFQREVGIDSVAADLLRAFFDANHSRAFYFYFFAEGNFDATGASATGRYAVRFDGGIERTVAMGRQAFRYRLAEVL